MTEPAPPGNSTKHLAGDNSAASRLEGSSLASHNPATSKEQILILIRLGQIKLPAGQAPLTLRALEIPGKSVLDVRRVTLTLVDP